MLFKKIPLLGANEAYRPGIRSNRIAIRPNPGTFGLIRPKMGFSIVRVFLNIASIESIESIEGRHDLIDAALPHQTTAQDDVLV